MSGRPAGVLATILVASLVAGSAAASLIDIPERYRVRASGVLRVVDYVDIEIPSADIEYRVDGAGNVSITLIRARPRGGDIRISRTVLFWSETTTVPVHCPMIANVGRIDGSVDSGGTMLFPAGARVTGLVHDAPGPGPDGCPGAGGSRLFTITSDAVVTGRHAPERDDFRLLGRFRTTVEGEDFDIVLALQGTYSNRPPEAVTTVPAPISVAELQNPVAWFEPPGCPRLSGVNPPTVEANHPDGYLVTIASLSTDPDGVYAASDIGVQQWGHWRGPNPPESPSEYEFIGRGLSTGPRVYEIGPRHVVLLQVFDRQGFEDRAMCSFRVADRRPPRIFPPPEVGLPCTVPGGVTPRTSAELRKFLAGATAEDATDPSPVAHPPLVGGEPVDEDTLFPPGDTRVSFPFEDLHGNLGAKVGVVSVEGGEPELRLVPGSEDTGADWVRLYPELVPTDACGRPLHWRLLTVSTNGSEEIDGLFREVEHDKDGRLLYEIRPLPLVGDDGVPIDRVFSFAVEVSDGKGFSDTLEAEFVVPAASKE